MEGCEENEDTLRPSGSFHFNDGRRFIFEKDKKIGEKEKKEDVNFLYEKQKAISRIALLSADSR